MVKIAEEAGQKCTLNKPLYCPKNGEHLIINIKNKPGNCLFVITFSYVMYIFKVM
jgi:hypothetical protein